MTFCFIYCVHFSAINFLLSTALAVSHKFWYALYSFTLIYFLISLATPSLTYGLFRSVLFGIQIFGDFPVNFLLLHSSLILLWSEDTLDITSFKFIEISFMAQNMVSLHPYTFYGSLKRMCVLMLVDRGFCKCLLNPVNL